MECKYVKSKVKVPISFSASNIDQFKEQFRDLLLAAKEPQGIVYLFRSANPFPRLRGESSIIYIGKANYSLYDRYASQIDNETSEYWGRYQYIISTFGNISVEIYETDNPKITENNFLYQYRQQFLELPPLNFQSYKVSLLDQE